METGGPPLPENVPTHADPAKDDSSSTGSPESNSQTELTPQGEKALKPSLDTDPVAPRYPTRRTVTTRGATTGAAGND